jgi:hypothetical protein
MNLLPKRKEFKDKYFVFIFKKIRCSYFNEIVILFF